MSGIWLADCSKLAVNWKTYSNITIFWHDVIIQFFWCCFMSLVKFTGPGFMSISSLVLELWQYPFIRDWPEIWKSEIPLSEFCPIPGEWGKLWIPYLAQTSLIKCYWMLQNTRVTAFTISELLRENQQWGGGSVGKPYPSPSRLGLGDN